MSDEYFPWGEPRHEPESGTPSEDQQRAETDPVAEGGTQDVPREDYRYYADPWGQPSDDQRVSPVPSQQWGPPDEPTQPIAGQTYGDPSGQGAHQPWAQQPPMSQPQQPGPWAPGAYQQRAAYTPPQTMPMPAYVQQSQPGQSGQHGQKRSGLAGWVWPAVAALALVLGVAGGAIGGAAYTSWRSDHTNGQTAGGLGDSGTVTQAPLPPQNGSVAAVAKALLPSTVEVDAEYDGKKDAATGSGFVLDESGHVITNNHVVASAVSDNGPIEIVDSNGNRYDAKVVGTSTVYDLAVLYVKDISGKLKPASLGASRALNVGDGVVAFGSPLGLSSTVTAGIVSALNRPVTTTGTNGTDNSYINAVQTDAAINPGNSGGPLVNMAGQVVGVNSAIATTGSSSGSESGNIGVGFAIPIEQVKITADQILRTGKASYPIIGAKVDTGGTASDGATISEVEAGKPAADGGLRKGDKVIALDGHRVTDGISLIVAIRTHQPGQTVDLTVVRGSQTLHVRITLAAENG